MRHRSQREQQRHPTGNLRYTFEAEGKTHRAVCSNIAIGGAFFRARFVPAPEQSLTLHASPSESGIVLVCRVVWSLAQPRLDAPETGFGVAFEEVYSTRSEASFLAFLRAEFGLHDVEVTQQPRNGRAAYVYSFATEPSVRPMSSDIANQSRIAGQPSIKEPSSSNPRMVLVSWAKGEAFGHLNHIANSMLRVVLKDTPPSLYEGVTLTPCFPSFQMPALIMHGTVTGTSRVLSERGEEQVAIRIWEIEELDDNQTFEVYRQVVDDS